MCHTRVNARIFRSAIREMKGKRDQVSFLPLARGSWTGVGREGGKRIEKTSPWKGSWDPTKKIRWAPLGRFVVFNHSLRRLKRSPTNRGSRGVYIRRHKKMRILFAGQSRSKHGKLSFFNDRVASLVCYPPPRDREARCKGCVVANCTRRSVIGGRNRMGVILSYFQFSTGEGVTSTQILLSILEHLV